MVPLLFPYTKVRASPHVAVTFLCFSVVQVVVVMVLMLFPQT